VFHDVFSVPAVAPRLISAIWSCVAGVSLGEAAAILKLPMTTASEPSGLMSSARGPTPPFDPLVPLKLW